MLAKIKSYLVRWQESYVWLPVLVVIALLAWIVLGAIDKDATSDQLSNLVELPIRTAYAVAALALAYLARRRQRRKLTDEEQTRLWDSLLEGKRGAIIIYVTDTIVWIVSIALLLSFFWLSR